jgi:hypothetical protein
MKTIWFFDLGKRKARCESSFADIQSNPAQVPADARWTHFQGSAKLPTIGKTVDDAMFAIERDNPRLKAVLPKDYARPGFTQPSHA